MLLIRCVGKLVIKIKYVYVSIFIEVLWFYKILFLFFSFFCSMFAYLFRVWLNSLCYRTYFVLFQYLINDHYPTFTIFFLFRHRQDKKTNEREYEIGKYHFINVLISNPSFRNQLNILNKDIKIAFKIYSFCTV